jgi:uncharacterized protein involved in response to NO
MGPEHAIHSGEALIFFACLFLMTISLALCQPLLKPRQWRNLLGGLAICSLAVAAAISGKSEAQRILFAAALMLGFMMLIFGSRK